jgi:Protein of unknown function (DUF2892)
MSKNLSATERGIRALIAIALLTLYQMGITAGLLGSVVTTLGIILLFTAAIGYCPIYSLFKKSK